MTDDCDTLRVRLAALVEQWKAKGAALCPLTASSEYSPLERDERLIGAFLLDLADQLAAVLNERRR